MSDLLSEDQTRQLFRQLRADELPQVLPPGTDDVRRTVRRRRVATTAIAAAVAAVVLAGGAVGSAALLRSSGHPLVPAAPTYPTHPSGDNPTDLGQQARTAVSSMNQIPLVLSSGPLTSTVQDVDQGPGGRGEPQYTYTLAYACRGSGAATITWSIGNKTQTATMTCGQPPSTTPLKPDGTLSITGEGVITVRIEPDTNALNHAGYAYIITKA